ncbi:MAG TPA: hypothetical protein VFW33_02705, partial [Gemmataceae bacterium]|nr:hypothetical protein [Gemmataceae bacterium]
MYLALRHTGSVDKAIDLLAEVLRDFPGGYGEAKRATKRQSARGLPVARYAGPAFDKSADIRRMIAAGVPQHVAIAVAHRNEERHGRGLPPVTPAAGAARVVAAPALSPGEAALLAEHCQHMLPEDAHLAHGRHAAAMAAHWAALPPDEEYRAAALAGVAKRGWYANSADAIREHFGEHAPRFAALLGATSPREPVNRNLKRSLQIFRAWLRAGKPTGTGGPMMSVPGVVGKEGQPIMMPAWLAYARDVDNPHFGSHLRNVLTAMTARREELAGLRLSGPKVESFRRNLLGDPDPSTNDAWMAYFAGIDPKAFGHDPTYAAHTAKIRKVAQQLGWKPAEVQGSIWSYFRELARLQKGGLTPQEALRSITHEHVAGSQDFSDLLRGAAPARGREPVGLGVGGAESGGGRSGQAAPVG